MPMKNFHSVRLRDPKKYKGFAYKKNMYGDDVSAVIGITGRYNSETQAIRFPVTKFKTVAAVKKWLDAHADIIPVATVDIEPAGEPKKKNPSNKAMRDWMYGGPAKELRLQHGKLENRLFKIPGRSHKWYEIKKQMAEIAQEINKIEKKAGYTGGRKL